MGKPFKKEETRGRKKLLTQDEILDAAVELGLENLTMTGLAEHLGVVTGTLYQYFENKRELFSAAAAHALSIANISLPIDTGQDWKILARGYAEYMRKILAQNHSFLHNLQVTEYGFNAHFEIAEKFLEMMTKRGFSSDEGMRLCHLVHMVGVTGAIEQLRQSEFETHHETRSEFAERMMKQESFSKYPNVRDVFPTFAMSPEDKFDLMLASVLAFFEKD